MAYSKFLAVLLGSQLGCSVSSINKTGGHGTIRIHQNSRIAYDEPALLRVVNKTRPRPTRYKQTKNNNNNNNNNAYFKNAKNTQNGNLNLNLDKKAAYKIYKNAFKDPIKTISQVTALFSNTFYNIFSFQENNRPVPAITTTAINHKIAEIKSHNNNNNNNKLKIKEEIKDETDNEIKDSLKSEEDSNLDRDYAAAYADYISNVLGSDLESAVNGDGNSEYYYSDDYIDYEFDSISQIEDTTTTTIANRMPENKFLDETTTSNKTNAFTPEKTRPHMLHPEPVVLFSIALTLFGLLQIIMASKKTNTNQSGSLSCLPDEDEDDDDDEEEAEKENNNCIIIDSERRHLDTKMLIHNQKLDNSRIGQNVEFGQNTVPGVKTTISGQHKSRRNAKSYPISLDKIDEEPLSV